MSRPRTGAEIREAFLSFYEAQEHLRLPSDSLVPTNDPTLLFTGAGMNQFKDEFMGRGRDLSRATTVQKCLRVPDLENVGLTPRHHTFFEMLGNFSFGDYFKKEVIAWEWEFFTKVLGWDSSRFVVTVFEDDDEAFDIWHSAIGLAPERIYRLGEKENFWPSSAPSKGPNGVCGPCSEIYWDQEPGKPLPANAGLEELPDRFVEVGNFVFTQFDRKDGGVLEPLPQKNIDVGLGFERIVAVAQDAANNFETDIFEPLLELIQQLSGRTYGESDSDDVRMRRVSDHARAVFFCIADGAAPGRDGRGYVVRKILRRAVRDGIELGLDKPFLADLIPSVQATMGAAYPEIVEQESTIAALVRAEEVRFREVYERGVARLDEFMQELKHQRGVNLFPGEMAFKLHDSWGFPVDITEVIVSENGFEFDLAGFETAMEEQRERARSGTDLSVDVFAESLSSRLEMADVKPTLFLGYEQLSCQASILTLLDETGASVMAFEKGDAGEVVLGRTPFYAEGGGQVGDSGLLLSESGEPIFRVTTTRKEGAYFIHCGEALLDLKPALVVTAQVNAELRRATERHHTATHLLHAALQTVLGTHVNQAGSRVSPEGLRFDYTQPEAMSLEQLRQVEALVQEQAMQSSAIEPFVTSLDEAKERGVTALFGEKYGNEVRVVAIADFSEELCGGTHVPNTGWIGPFRITSDRALAAGVRRIEAVAGAVATELSRTEQDVLRELSQSMKCPEDRIIERVENFRKQLKDARKIQKAAGPTATEVAGKLKTQGDSFAWLILEGLEADSLRELAEGFKTINGMPKVILLVGGDKQKVPFCFRCKADSSHKAGDLAKALGQKLRGGGGGRPDFAQGQGSDGSDLEGAIKAFSAETLSRT